MKSRPGPTIATRRMGASRNIPADLMLVSACSIAKPGNMDVSDDSPRSRYSVECVAAFASRVVELLHRRDGTFVPLALANHSRDDLAKVESRLALTCWRSGIHACPLDDVTNELQTFVVARGRHTGHQVIEPLLNHRGLFRIAQGRHDVCHACAAVNVVPRRRKLKTDSSSPRATRARIVRSRRETQPGHSMLALC